MEIGLRLSLQFEETRRSEDAAASSPTSTLGTKQFRTAGEIDRAIANIQGRLRDIETLRDEQLSDADVQVRNVEHDTRDALEDVFGAGSPEFARFQKFTIGPGRYDSGMLEDLDVAAERAQAKFGEHLPGAILKIRSLIKRLEERRDALNEPEAVRRITFEGKSLHPNIDAAA